MEEEIAILEDWDSVPNATSDVSKKLHKYVMALVKIVKDQQKTIEEMKKQLNNNQANSNEAPRQTWASMFSGDKKDEGTMVMMASMNREISEKERIQNNVVITGIGYSEDDTVDKEKVDKVLQILKLERSKVKSQRRIKTARNEGNALDKIVVTFNNISDKYTALANAKSLRQTADLSKVYVNPDKTQCERTHDRNLRAIRNERNKNLTHEGDNTEGGRHRYSIKTGGPNNGKKFYWGIRGGSLREIFRD